MVAQDATSLLDMSVQDQSSNEESLQLDEDCFISQLVENKFALENILAIWRHFVIAGACVHMALFGCLLNCIMIWQGNKHVINDIIAFIISYGATLILSKSILAQVLGDLHVPCCRQYTIVSVILVALQYTYSSAVVLIMSAAMFFCLPSNWLWWGKRGRKTFDKELSVEEHGNTKGSASVVSAQARSGRQQSLSGQR